jgi:hypothetical protein
MYAHEYAFSQRTEIKRAIEANKIMILAAMERGNHKAVRTLINILHQLHKTLNELEAIKAA